MDPAPGPPPPPPEGGVSIDLGTPLLVLLALVAGWVAFRVVRARRRGEPAACAAAQGLADAGPPVLGLAIALLAVVGAFLLLVAALVAAAIASAFDLPFDILGGLAGGESPAAEPQPGAFDEVGPVAIALVGVAIASVCASVAWIVWRVARAGRRRGAGS